MGKINNKVTIVQELGDSKEKVMSQAAVSSLFPPMMRAKMGRNIITLKNV